MPQGRSHSVKVEINGRVGRAITAETERL
jgi:hypothetical protein